MSLSGQHYCSQCSRTFRRRSAWTRHMDSVHNSEPTYICTIDGCNMRFKRKDSLQRHKSSQHGISKVRCPSCTKLIRKDDLQNHQQRAVCRFNTLLLRATTDEPNAIQTGTNCSQNKSLSYPAYSNHAIHDDYMNVLGYRPSGIASSAEPSASFWPQMAELDSPSHSPAFSLESISDSSFSRAYTHKRSNELIESVGQDQQALEAPQAMCIVSEVAPEDSRSFHGEEAFVGISHQANEFHQDPSRFSQLHKSTEDNPPYVGFAVQETIDASATTDFCNQSIGNASSIRLRDSLISNIWPKMNPFELEGNQRHESVHTALSEGEDPLSPKNCSMSSTAQLSHYRPNSNVMDELALIPAPVTVMHPGKSCAYMVDSLEESADVSYENNIDEISQIFPDTSPQILTSQILTPQILTSASSIEEVTSRQLHATLMSSEAENTVLESDILPFEDWSYDEYSGMPLQSDVPFTPIAERCSEMRVSSSSCAHRDLNSINDREALQRPYNFQRHLMDNNSDLSSERQIGNLAGPSSLELENPILSGTDRTVRMTAALSNIGEGGDEGNGHSGARTHRIEIPGHGFIPFQDIFRALAQHSRCTCHAYQGTLLEDEISQTTFPEFHIPRPSSMYVECGSGEQSLESSRFLTRDIPEFWPRHPPYGPSISRFCSTAMIRRAWEVWTALALSHMSLITGSKVMTLGVGAGASAFTYRIITSRLSNGSAWYPTQAVSHGNRTNETEAVLHTTLHATREGFRSIWNWIKSRYRYVKANRLDGELQVESYSFCTVNSFSLLARCIHCVLSRGMDVFNNGRRWIRERKTEPRQIQQEPLQEDETFHGVDSLSGALSSTARTLNRKVAQRFELH